jgi:hypothetical protein
MTTRGLAFRQDFAAQTPPVAKLVSAADPLRRILIEQQRDEGFWTDEWASNSAPMGAVGVTATAAIALMESGTSPAAPEVSRAIDWLWGRTVAPAAKDPDPPEVESLLALTAFVRAGRVTADRKNAVVADAIQSLRELQNDDGGWFLARGDHQGSDRSDPETTGDVLTVFGLCGIPLTDPTAKMAMEYLEREQEPDSGWSDLTATAAVLSGVRAIGIGSQWLPVRRAAEWIKRMQSADGSWGDPFATAIAIRALSAASLRPTPEIRAGMAWLTANPPDGSALLPLIAAIRVTRLEQ